MVTIRSEWKVESMREVSRILANVHEELGKVVKPGASTRETDRICEETIRSQGCIPSFSNYQGFPASVYISTNGGVAYGIPDKHRYLESGDTISLDTGVMWKRYQSNTARTHIVGEVSGTARKLVKVTEQSPSEEIKYVEASDHLNDMSKAIQAYAESFGFGVVRDLARHGIGTEMYGTPKTPNFAQCRKGIRPAAGVTSAIEPITAVGRCDVAWTDDGRTVVTEDGSLTSYYENTILITDGGPGILSLQQR